MAPLPRTQAQPRHPGLPAVPQLCPHHPHQACPCPTAPRSWTPARITVDTVHPSAVLLSGTANVPAKPTQRKEQLTITLTQAWGVAFEGLHISCDFVFKGS